MEIFESPSLRGNFNRTPFPAVCLEIWRAQLTGKLSFQENIDSPELLFKEGNLVISTEQLDSEKFTRFVAARENSSIPGENFEEAKIDLDSPSLIKNLIEKHSLPPQNIWKYLHDFFLLTIQPLFDLTEGNYFFQPASTPTSEKILLQLSTPEAIQSGIFKMKSLDQLDNYYPDKTAIVRIKKTASELPWLPDTAKYLLSLLSKPITINQLIELSQLGEKETYRLLYLFSCFKIINLSLSKSINILNTASPQKLAQTISVFMEKSSIIMKYLSKEIGPVATNIIKKSISECKNTLPPIFSDLEVEENGKIIFGRVFRAGITYASPELQEKIIDGLNELLLNQILAVKKTLGDDHEIRLVDALQSFAK